MYPVKKGGVWFIFWVFKSITPFFTWVDSANIYTFYFYPLIFEG